MALSTRTSFSQHKYLKLYINMGSSKTCLQYNKFVVLGAHESLVQNADPVTIHVHLLHLSPLGNTAPAL